MVTEVSPLQPSNAWSLIEVTELGIVTEVSPLQPLNAPSPIEVTELGMVVFLQPEISVFVAVSIIALQLFRESYFVFPLSTTILVSPLQPSNAWSPIEVTEFGMVTDVSPRQSRNAPLPIEVTELGMSTEVSLLQPSNA